MTAMYKVLQYFGMTPEQRVERAKRRLARAEEALKRSLERQNSVTVKLGDVNTFLVRLREAGVSLRKAAMLSDPTANEAASMSNELWEAHRALFSAADALQFDKLAEVQAILVDVRGCAEHFRAMYAKPEPEPAKAPDPAPAPQLALGTA
jgi:hypothetical protein